ncbi:hypothetical protein [Falsibacillus pallidus]|uniref:Helix-turn-helix resolvase-like protein n=1 Tax=Falsibacillus pallidus TaxID=493781 RepID=A0A370GKS8_9BACI|nr:hypothetical protein [Falsibacillus pallidus]RDI43960.1 hypothetical protein DFR59_10322 [Falsibacillus pallidus]
MENILIGLFIIAGLLFILSFFQKDKVKMVEKEVEELSLNFYQETYQLKNRMKVLEEEILVEGNAIEFKPVRQRPGKNSTKVNEILKNQVLALHKQGLDIEQISKQSSLSLAEIKEIIK